MTVLSRFSSFLIVTAVAAGLLFAAAGNSTLAQTSDRADPGMLPDHPMYFTKSMSESIGTFFTFGKANQAERSLELSERRLAEARALAADGKSEEAEKAIGRYRVQLDRALSKAKQAQANGDDAETVLTDVSEATPRHQAILAEVYEKVPEQARPGIERAMEASRRGQEQAGNARSNSRGRPESAGPAKSRGQGQGPPDGQGTRRPDRPDRDTDREERGDRAERGEHGPPDSVTTGRPDTTGR